MLVSIILIGLGLTLGFSTGVEAIERSVKCEAAKLKEAGKYGFCRLKEESKGLKKARTPVFAKCDSKITKAYAKVESQAAGACPTSGDVGKVRTRVIQSTAVVRKALQGVRFIDNGDGTITDNQTGLMWEKKVAGSGCLHCVDDTYSWTDAMSEWISEVNGGLVDFPPNAQSGLGGHTNWRLPTIVELQTIPLEPFPCGTSPCIDLIFGPTATFLYWSSSIAAFPPFSPWVVNFSQGNVLPNPGEPVVHARAVRDDL